MSNDKYCALDFETFYEGTYSLRSMSTPEYVYDKRFDAYMAAYCDENGTVVAHPKDFDWSLLKGRHVFMHNAYFDGLVLRRLTEDGVVPKDCAPRSLIDTADMAVYFKTMRNLKDAAKYLLGVEIKKETRDKMKGLTYKDAVAQGLEDELIKYGGGDAETTYALGTKYLPDWPDIERFVSDANREAGWAGIAIDQVRLQEAIDVLSKVRWEAGAKIPWTWPEDKTPLSLEKAREECRKAGIPAPASFAKDSEECQEWEDAHGEKFPWIAALRDWRRSNAYLQKFETIRDRLRDGCVPYSLKIYGAHTGRLSSEEGLNILNLDKNAKFGADIRQVFVPRPGHKFIIADLSQIEPRVLALLSGNKEFLEQIRGTSPYEVHARQSMGWAGGDLKKENPTLYSVAKARVLALGYQAGWKKFIFMLRLWGEDPYKLFDWQNITTDDRREFLEYLLRIHRDEDAEEFKVMEEKEKNLCVAAWQQVNSFRRTNPKITALWYSMQQMLQESADKKEDLEITLPSGRSMTYFAPFRNNGELWASTMRGDRHRKFYGGKIVENITQATARDFFNEGWRRLENNGFHVLWTIYDEYVIEVPENKIDLKAVRELITAPPLWCPDFPLDCSVEIADHYKK